MTFENMLGVLSLAFMMGIVCYVIASVLFKDDADG